MAEIQTFVVILLTAGLVVAGILRKMGDDLGSLTLRELVAARGAILVLTLAVGMVLWRLGLLLGSLP